DTQRDASSDAENNNVVLANASPHQMICQLIALAIQEAIADLFDPVLYCNGVTTSIRRRFDHLMRKRPALPVNCSRIPRFQYLLTLGIAQQANVGNPIFSTRGHQLEYRFVMARHSFDCCRIEQVS